VVEQVAGTRVIELGDPRRTRGRVVAAQQRVVRRIVAVAPRALGLGPQVRALPRVGV
jgi:hypothetical protein